MNKKPTPIVIPVEQPKPPLEPKIFFLSFVASTEPIVIDPKTGRPRR